MIRIIICDTADELEMIKAKFPELTKFVVNETEPKKQEREWLTAPEFEEKLTELGYKASSLITKKRICIEHGIPYKKFGHNYKFRNETDRIGPRKTIKKISPLKRRQMKGWA